MSNETSQDEKIERYLGGQMSLSERETFEREISSSEQLRRSLRIEQAITKGIAVERSSVAPRHAEMRSRAIDAIARIAPAVPPVVPADPPNEGSDRSRRSTGLWITGGVLALAFGVGGGLLMQPSSTTAPQPVVQPAVPGASTQTPPELKIPPAMPPATEGTTEVDASAAESKEPAAIREGKNVDGVKSRSDRGSRTEPRVDAATSADRTAGTNQGSTKPPRTMTDPNVKIPVVDETAPNK